MVLNAATLQGLRSWCEKTSFHVMQYGLSTSTVTQQTLLPVLYQVLLWVLEVSFMQRIREDREAGGWEVTQS